MPPCQSALTRRFIAPLALNAVSPIAVPGTATFRYPKQCCSRPLATVSNLTAASHGSGIIESAGRDPRLATTTITPGTPLDRSQPPHTVLATVYSFPDMEPLRFAYYSTAHLQAPLRRDLLQRAIVYEGDNARQGTANTKWRSEVRGSGRKLAPQKGQGRARVGDKKSPTRRGGGVAFGPKPRDFSTDLPRKIYDRAWRIALSHRYRRGELVVVDTLSSQTSPDRASLSWLQQAFEANGWAELRNKSLLVAEHSDQTHQQLLAALEGQQGAGQGPRLAGRFSTADDVDVKDLLSMHRVIIEHRALNRLLYEHSSDLVADMPLSAESLAAAAIATGQEI